ncbi:MAG: hypothetical protein AAF703_07390 [Cyanobacteria bacterium P01_D01_bin.105]
MTNYNRISNSLSSFSSTDAVQNNYLLTHSSHYRLGNLGYRSPDSKQENGAALTWGSHIPTPNVLKRLAKSLVAVLLGEQSMRIWTSYRKGELVWHVYDPISDRRSSHKSENDLRAWLENRHLS